jgi:ABC-type Fe3+-siderophore transport system permease subunit
MIRRIRIIRRSADRRERVPSPSAIGVCCAIYFLGALGVYTVDQGYLLFAWLMSGLLGVAVYLTLDLRGSLANPYTLFFAAVVMSSLGGYIYSALGV